LAFISGPWNNPVFGGSRCRGVHDGRKGEPRKISAVRDALDPLQKPFYSVQIGTFAKNMPMGLTLTRLAYWGAFTTGCFVTSTKSTLILKLVCSTFTLLSLITLLIFFISVLDPTFHNHGHEVTMSSTTIPLHDSPTRSIKGYEIKFRISVSFLIFYFI